MIGTIVTVLIALIIGGLIGYAAFRYVITGKYKEIISSAEKEAEVLKERSCSR